MIRISKTEPVEIDLFMPVNKNNKAYKDPNDCFGKLWSCTAKECKLCASHNTCGAVFASTTFKENMKKADETLKSGKKLSTDFKLPVDTEQKIVNKIVQLSATDSPLTYDELFNYIVKQLYPTVEDIPNMALEFRENVKSQIDIFFERNPEIKYNEVLTTLRV